MLCLKNRHRVLIYSLPLLFAVVCSLFFGRASVSATSSSINPVIGSVQSIDVSNLGFTPNFLVFDLDYSSANTFQKINATYSVGSNISGNPFNSNFSDSFCNYVIKDSVKLNHLICQFDSTKSPVYRINPIFSDQFSVGITMTLYDVLPGDCDPCPVCPPIPETQYGDILDKIYHAIILVPAMAFVLYLFYILFGWYVGGRR